MSPRNEAEAGQRGGRLSKWVGGGRPAGWHLDSLGGKLQVGYNLDGCDFCLVSRNA